jgi:hypothetical protein
MDTEDNLYNRAIDKLKYIALNLNNIIIIVSIIMEIVEDALDDGNVKKETVLKIVKRIFTDFEGIDENERREILKLITNGMISNTIDIIISASKGELNLNNAITLTTKIGRLTYKLCRIFCFKKKKKIKREDLII